MRQNSPLIQKYQTITMIEACIWSRQNSIFQKGKTRLYAAGLQDKGRNKTPDCGTQNGCRAF
jgi:hypothetical protein